MLRKIDRVILRVANLPAAVSYYRDVMGLSVVREEARLASLRMGEGDDAAEMILHTDPDLPGEAVYYLVDDVREMYRRRSELKLRFASPPTQVSRGYRATVKDPFDNVLLILDRTTESSAANVEDAKAPGGLFSGVETKSPMSRQRLIEIYEKIGRTADDLPYTPHFESLYSQYIAPMPEPKPTRAEVWRHLLTLRKKAGNLPKLGPARSRPPAVSPEDRQKLREMIGEEMGKRDRLPYTPRFDQIVDDFNKTQPRNLSPHLVWRLVATLAK